ncbi:MAG: helix-turn-helix transcriptional regulator [Candidatus Hydrogenedentes bacterium]|nr:helix-turn-helix transcriptional regulator [Candidatus Hydrogenedentota bacterium]
MAATISDISNTCIIPEGCREQFLPSRDDAPGILAAHGVWSGGLSRLVPGYDYGRVSSPQHILEFTVDGAAQYLTGASRGTLRAGDVFIGPAETSFRYWVEEGHWTSVWFCLRNGEPWADLIGKAPHIRRAYVLDALGAATRGLLAESVRSGPFTARLRELFAEQIVLLLRRELGSYSTPRESALRNRIHALWEHVNADLAHPWSVDELAGRVNLSPPHFHRVMKRYLGMSPRAALIELRMKRTEELLLTRAIPLKTIADLVGYATPFALSKAFARYKGTSPAAFRAQHQGGVG